MTAAYDFNSTKTKRDVFKDAVVDLIDRAIERHYADTETPRTYIGASALGDQCQRRIQFEVTGAPGTPHNGKTRRIFERGHIYEPHVANWLRGAGFKLRTERDDGTQFGFIVANGHIAGHCDGIIDDGPAIEGLIYPCLWECKVVGDKGYRGVAKDGVAKAYPQYADQVALYQAYLDCTNPALFTALNANDMNIHPELVKFDEARAQAASDRGVTIITADSCGELLPRAAGDPDQFPCRFCRFSEHCWNDGGLGPRRTGEKR